MFFSKNNINKNSFVQSRKIYKNFAKKNRKKKKNKEKYLKIFLFIHLKSRKKIKLKTHKNIAKIYSLIKQNCNKKNINKMWALNKINLNSSVWLIMTVVVTVLLPLTHGQAYHFIIGHHQSNFGQLYRETNNRNYVADTNYTDTSTADLENTNSTIIVTTVRESNELSQTAMDIITIVWYVATFLALAAFFLLMACSDRRCSDTQRNANVNTNETPIPPPTPSPSYSEFAPPSYESVMKMQIASKNNVYVVPFNTDSAKDGNIPSTNNTTNSGNLGQQASPITPNINFYTINELHKLGS